MRCATRGRPLRVDNRPWRAVRAGAHEFVAHWTCVTGAAPEPGAVCPFDGARPRCPVCDRPVKAVHEREGML